MKPILIYTLFVTTFFLVSCKERYDPPVVKTNLNFLVIDGSIINGPDSSIIRLSRTKELDNDPLNGGEQQAQMTIEDADGTTLYNFIPVNNKGIYAVPGMVLDVNKKYKLRINTTNGDQFISDDLVVKDTPPIDSINWQLRPDGVTVYANTHDPSNTAKYYRWEYTETWDYYSHFFSVLKYQLAGTIDSMFLNRNADEFVYHCWKTVNSSEIILGSSVKLSSDVISLSPIRYIPTSSFEISSIYSILVKQYTVSKEAFDYFQNLKKISEQTGSLFDAQPSQLGGNIHSIARPDDPVLGFVTAASIQKQRIFITQQQVAPWNYSVYCPDPRKVPLILDSLKYFFDGASPLYIPIDKYRDPGTGQVTAILGGLPVCANCISRGGTNVKPDFWP